MANIALVHIRRYAQTGPLDILWDRLLLPYAILWGKRLLAAPAGSLSTRTNHMASDEHTVELLQGTLDVLVLKALSWGPAHGYSVARWLQDVTDDALRVEEGSLYPALHRLEKRGFAEARWGVSENNRKAKYYRITARGRQHLRQEATSWSAFAVAVGKVLASSKRPALA
jgi:PadR family transcriptional regulator PadR